MLGILLSEGVWPLGCDGTGVRTQKLLHEF